MLEELKIDIAAQALYISERLTTSGKAKYPELLRLAMEMGNDTSLVTALNNGLFNPTYLRKKPKGGYSEVKMPVNAPETLAEGEFNRFYIRALCRRAIEEGHGVLKIYRAKPVHNPRPESEILIGQTVDAHKLLQDLRTNIGIETALGVPPGPNSGLSVKLA